MRAMPDREPRHYNREPFQPGTVVKYVGHADPYTYVDTPDPAVFVPYGTEGVVVRVNVSTNAVIFHVDNCVWRSQAVNPIRLTKVDM